MCRWILMCMHKRRWTFSLNETLLWITNSNYCRKQWFKCLNNGFVCYNHAAFYFTRCSLMDWSHVDYLWVIVMFLSAVWTHSDGTHSLQRIHWWARDIMFNFSKSVLMQSSLIFGWTIPLKTVYWKVNPFLDACTRWCHVIMTKQQILWLLTLVN